MRTFHFKITVRRLMLSVAIAALLLAGHSAGRRWAFCRERAAYYAERERYHLRLADEEWQLLTAYRSRPCLTLPGGQDKELTCLAGGNLRNAPIGVYFARLDGYDYSPLKMYIRGYLTQEQSEPITLTPKRGE